MSELVTGTVTLSLAEVDKLRDTIKEKDKEYIKLFKEFDEVRADKRVIIKKVEIYPHLKSIHSTYSLVDFCNSLIRSVSTEIEHTHGYHDSRYYKTLADDVYGRYFDTHRANETIEYTNFEDVKIELKKEVEKQTAQEVGALRQQVNTLEVRRGELEEQYKMEADLNEKKWRKEFNEAQKNYDLVEAAQKERYKELEQKYEDLKSDKKRISLEAKIAELQTALDIEKAKPWYKKLFS